MSVIATRFDLDPALPFKYVGGDPAIDLVNTVDYLDGELVEERLATYDGLTWWAEGAGVVTAAEGEALRGRAALDPTAARAAFEGALGFRALLYRLFSAVAAGDVPSDLLTAFNATLAVATARLRVAEGGDAGLGWSWDGWSDALAAPLWPVVWSAARLITSDEQRRIRVCGAGAKARRHYARKRGATASPPPTP